MLEVNRIGWLTRAAVGLLIGSLMFGGTSRRLILAAEAAACAAPAGTEGGCHEAPNSAGFSHGFFRALRKGLHEVTVVISAASIVPGPSFAASQPPLAVAIPQKILSADTSLQRLDVRLQV
jgi:hypothetical protein